MAFCLNPDCPHRQEMGYPAEFREGITHCSDCGSLLTEEIIGKENTQKLSPRITLPDLHKRVLYTIGFVLLYRVLLLIPAPGINFQALQELFGYEGFFQGIFGYGAALGRLSVVALGVLPYLTASMIIEILSLFIQPLKSWRADAYQGRIKIKRVALFATFLLALWQGYGVAHGLEGMLGPVGEKMVTNPGLSFRLISALTITAGTFVMTWVADLITKRGIGHGISILIFVGYAPRIFSNFPQIKWVPDEHSHSILEYFLLFAVLAIALMALIVVMEKSFRRVSVKFSDGTEAYIPLKLTSAGIMPVEWTSTLIMLPTTVLLFVKNVAHPNWKLPEPPMNPGIWYYVIYFTITIFLYYLFTSFFYDPKKIVTFLKSRQASIVSPQGDRGESYFDRSLEFMVPIAAVYLCTVLFAPNSIFSVFFIFSIDTIGLITVVAILLDLMEEMRIRRKENHLVKVAELHDIPMAGLVKSLLEQKGFPCYLRGYYHRALLYFFGPYIEISVLVPEEKIADAREVIENYFEANILTVQSSKVQSG